MARIHIQGHNDEALTTTVKELISGLDLGTDGRVFTPQLIEITNEHATQVGLIDVYDMDEASAVAANQRGAFQIQPEDTLIIEYVVGAKRFSTNFGAVATNGTFPTLVQFASGYLI